MADQIFPSVPRLNVPLNALRAFEAAARLLSIKDAASELNVTPSAVSHQLKTLEEALGVDLMRRVGSRLELTPAGARLAPPLTEGFARISAGVADVTETRRKGPLRLSMLPTFAVHWLSPRLADYPFEKAGFELLISTSQEVVDLSAGAADAAVRHGAGQWNGLQADRLFGETVTLLAAPSMVAGRDPRAVVAGANLFLSQHRPQNWADWNASLPGGPVTPGAVTMVDSTGLALRAAADGAGLTLAGWEMAEADVKAGRLTPLFDHRTDADGAYWLVYPEALATDRRVRNLRRWLLGQIGPSAA